MPLVKNSEHTVRISGYSSDGAGVARIDGQVVFIPGTIDGELCRVKIIKVNKNIAYGRLVSVEQSSEHRIRPACEVYQKCGGCDYHHMDYEEELRAKRAHVQSVISRIAGLNIEVEPIVGAKSTERYRNKAQFPVGEASGRPISGFYRLHSHDIVPCEDCKIQSEFANEICKTVLLWMQENGIASYNESTLKGVVRHIYVRNNMLCLVVTEKPKKTNELVSMVMQKHPETSGILLNYNSARTNVILGDKTEVLHGDGYSVDTLCGNEFELSPHAFYQVNRNQAEVLYNLAISKAELCGNETVLDLYCGAGTITLAIARHAKNVIGVEIVPQAIENAKKNAMRNGIQNAEFICADTEEAAIMLRKRGVSAQVVVIDPPRKGLTPELIDTIAGISPKRVIYVSCDPATLARDLKLFNELGYKTKSVTPVDLFPRTRHIECAVRLCRE